ncbi:hypothetical protein HOM50_01495 [bacterium]|nr:hypothetical protein [bacterium]MBT5015063.1 hypothetical protein [bacterium]
MFKDIFQKVAAFEHHHQAIFAIVVAIGIVLFSWGIEKILEEYLFPGKPLVGYIFTILLGVFLLWMTKVVVLNLM